jgi:hypothetical protein
MIVNSVCKACQKHYDNVAQQTYCPHEILLTDEQLAQKEHALSLLGHHVWFSRSMGGIQYRVTAVRWDGMIMLNTLPWRFHPHHFTRCDAIERHRSVDQQHIQHEERPCP